MIDKHKKASLFTLTIDLIKILNMLLLEGSLIFFFLSLFLELILTVMLPRIAEIKVRHS